MEIKQQEECDQRQKKRHKAKYSNAEKAKRVKIIYFYFFLAWSKSQGFFGKPDWHYLVGTNNSSTTSCI